MELRCQMPILVSPSCGVFGYRKLCISLERYRELTIGLRIKGRNC